MYTLVLATAGSYKRYAFVTQQGEEHWDSAFSQFSYAVYSLENAVAPIISSYSEEQQPDGSIVVTFTGDSIIAGLVRQWILNAMGDPDFSPYCDTEAHEYSAGTWQNEIYAKVKDRVLEIYTGHSVPSNDEVMCNHSLM